MASVRSLPVRDFTSVVPTGPRTTLQVVGNQLELHDSQLQTTSFVSSLSGVDWSDAARISCVRFHAPKALLVVVAEGLSYSRAHVFKFPDGAHVCTIEGCYASSVSLSHDGSLLVAVDGLAAVPSLQAWELPSGQPLTWRSDDHRPTFPARVTQCSVDPFNINRVVAWGDAGVYIVTLGQQSLYYTASIAAAELPSSSGSGGGSGSTHFLDTGLVPPSTVPQISETAWNSGVLFMVTRDGQLLALNVSTGRATHIVLEDAAAPTGITSVTCVVDHLVVGFSTGVVQWFAKDDYSLVHTVTLPGGVGGTTRGGNRGGRSTAPSSNSSSSGGSIAVTALRPLPSYLSALAAQGRYQLTVISLNVDDESGPIPAPEVVRSAPPAAAAESVVQLLSLDAGHTLGVTASQLLVHDTEAQRLAACYSTHVVSGGRSSSSSSSSSSSYSSTITASALVPAVGVVAVGDDKGALTLVSVALAAPDASDPEPTAKVVASARVHDAPVSGLSADGDLVTALFVDAVVVVRVASGAAPALTAYARASSVSSSSGDAAAAAADVAVLPLVSAVSVAAAGAALVTDSAGKLFRFDLASSSSSGAAAPPAPSVLQRVDAPGLAAALQGGIPRLVVATGVDEGDDSVVLAYSATSSKVVSVDAATGATADVLDAGARITSVSVTSVAASSAVSAALLVTVGTADGAVQVWAVTPSGSSSSSKKVKKSKSRRSTSAGGSATVLWRGARFVGVRAAAADRSGTTVLVVGEDGLAVQYSTGAGSGKSRSSSSKASSWPAAASYPAAAASAASTAAESMLSAAAAQHADAQQHRIEAAQARLLSLAQPVKDEVARLLDRNAAAPDLERMDAAEFCANTRGRDSQLRRNEEAARALRATLLQANAKKAVLARRLKHAVWDSMETKGREIHAFQSGVVVSNFAVPRLAPEEQARLDRVVQLRKVELREIRFGPGAQSSSNSGGGGAGATAWPGRLDEVPAGAGYIAHTERDGGGPTSPGGDDSAESTGGGGGGGGGAVDGGDEGVGAAASSGGAAAGGGAAGGKGTSPQKAKAGTDDHDHDDLRSHEGQLESLEYVGVAVYWRRLPWGNVLLLLQLLLTLLLLRL
jgi:hypothetical protein